MTLPRAKLEMMIPSMDWPAPPEMKPVTSDSPVVIRETMRIFGRDFADWWSLVREQYEWWLRTFANTALATPENFVPNGSFTAWDGSIMHTVCPPRGWSFYGTGYALPAVVPADPLNGVAVQGAAGGGADYLWINITGLKESMQYSLSFDACMGTLGHEGRVSMETNLGRIITRTVTATNPTHCPSMAGNLMQMNLTLATGENAILLKFIPWTAGSTLFVGEVQLSNCPWCPDFRPSVQDVQRVSGDLLIPGKLTVWEEIDPTVMLLSDCNIASGDIAWDASNRVIQWKQRGKVATACQPAKFYQIDITYEAGTDRIETIVESWPDPSTVIATWTPQYDGSGYCIGLVRT